MRSSRRVWWTLACLALVFLALGAGLVATPTVAQSGSYEEVTTVLAVEIPVQVTLDGKPVRGLSQDDFEVQEGRKKRQIVDFDVVDLGDLAPGPAGEGDAPLPARSRRHFLLLFDLSFSDPDNVLKARRSAADLVLEGLHSTDLVAVATYGANRGAQLVLGFTGDREQTLAAIEGLGLVQPIDVPRDPLRMVIAGYEDRLAGQTDPYGSAGQGPGGVSQSQITATFVEALRDISTQVGQGVRDQKRNQIMDLSSSLGQLAELMATVEGRKQVVYLSEGFDSAVLLGTQDAERIGELADAAATGEFWRVDNEERFGSAAGQSGLFQMLEAFRRCDCAIQAVDIGGARSAVELVSRPNGDDGLFIMAEETGGELYRNYNQLSEAMESLLEATSVTYILVLEPRDVTADGSFHPLKVKLRKGVARGARVSHRPGYYAPRPYATQDPEARGLQTAQLISSGVAGGDIPLSILGVPFKTRAGGTLVETYIEVDGGTLVGGYEGKNLPVEIYAYALDEAGAMRDFFTQAIDIDLLKVGPLLRYSGFKMMGQLELPVGRHELRVLVRNSLTGSYGLERSTLLVPDYLKEPALLTPLFIEPEGTWVLGWADMGEGEREIYPLRVRDMALIPAARPTLPAGVEIPFLLVTHALSGGPVSIRGRLEMADGGEGPAIDVELENRVPAEVSGVERIWATLRSEPGVAGRFTLLVEVTDERSGRSLESSLAVYVQ